MSNEEIHQRIQYLIEHGGIWDDPLEDIRRYARVNRISIVVVALLVLADIALELL